jgi:UDPglucose--hexose-1-phosphate uridylyltransferase
MTNINDLTPRLVWNPLLSEWLIQAPGRMNRREGVDACAFCDDLRLGRVAPEASAWARPNDFPPLRPPAGECYIIIYSREHDQTFLELSNHQIQEVVRVWQTLYTNLAALYPCVMIFENNGAEIGQTQRHPHGQTYAVSQLPTILARELAAAEKEAHAGRGCLFCNLLREELAGPRLILQTAHWAAFVPPYARYPYEVHIYPRRHLPDFQAMHEDESQELGTLLLRVARAYNHLQEGALAPMPYMLGIHQLANERFHFHIELLPARRAPNKLKLPASAETAFGLWSNESLPEVKAAELQVLLANDGQMR